MEKERAPDLAARVARAPGKSIGLLALAVLSWCAASDVGFGDSAEIGSAGFGLGVAHPTGFALDLLLLRLASYLPLGHVALRQNLAVASEAALGLGLLAAICAELARRLSVESAAARWLGAAVACAALLGFRTFFATAIAVEVYSLALCAALLAGYAALRGGPSAGLACLVLGFAPGMHVTAGLFALLACLVLFAERGFDAGVRFVRARVPVIAAGAAIVCYLPLASRRNPALDWGDPETLSRMLAHLTAARIRGAFHNEMLASDPQVSLGFAGQLGELWPLFPFVALALAIGWRRKRLLMLAVLGFFALDAAYASFVNPMGVVDRQCGHMAGACLALLGGVGVAIGSASARGPRFAKPAAFALASALCALLLIRIPRAELDPGYAASELYGSGGALASVAPRALVLCSSDDACGNALFALDVEGVRPDVDVAPAQHLWDGTVLRRIEGVPELARFVHADPPSAARRAVAAAVLRILFRPELARPLRLESAAPLHWAAIDRALVPSGDVPYLELAVQGRALDLAAIERRLARLRDARLSSRELRAEHVRRAWSTVHSSLGDETTGTAFAVRLLRRAVELAPERAAAFTNLGVALEARGDMAGAIAAARHAIDLAPERATPWLNLARLELAQHGPSAAREIVDLAVRAGVDDPRLAALAHTLPPSERH